MIRNYFKIAWRNLLKNKSFTAINIFGISIGFASSIVIYLFLSHHLSFDNFHHDAQNIYRVNTEEHLDKVYHSATVPPGFAKVFREEFDYADKVAKIVRQSDLIIDVSKNKGSKKFKQDISFVEEDFFKIFNFPLLNGSRTISIYEPNTALVTENMARTLFGKKDVVGETFVLENNKTVEIIGVLRDLPQTTFLNTEIFVAFQNLSDISFFTSSEQWNGTTSILQCFARLKPNQNIAAIETALLELPKKYRPNSNNKHVYKLQALSDMHFNTDYGGVNPTFLIILGVIGLFLIGIASINFINMSTAQAFHRSKEIGVRKVLGSRKKQLFWQFLVETFLICLLALTLGILITASVLPSFNTLFELQLTLKPLLSVHFFVFLFVLLGLVSFLAGSYPGLLIARIAPVLALKGKLSQKDTGGTSTRKVLVVTQFAVSIMLIVATIVISKQIDYAVNSNLGFDKTSVVMLNIPKEIEPIQLNSLKQRLTTISGVENVSTCFGSPGAAENQWGASLKYNNKTENEEFQVSIKAADEYYLDLFNIPLVAGRNFLKPESTNEIIVNEQCAKKLGINEVEALLGKEINVNGSGNKTIVGVVENFHDKKFTEDIAPIIITPKHDWYYEIALKINHLNTSATLAQIDEQWSRTFSNNMFEYRFLDESIAELYETEQRYLSFQNCSLD